MAKIECPICDRNVTSQDAIGLGDSFKRHLMEVHRMTSLACIDMNEGVGPVKGAAGRITDIHRGETEIEREHESRIWPEGSARSSSRVVDEHAPREEVREVTTTGAYGTEAKRMGEAVTAFAIKCPFCTSVFRADADEALGKDLREHWGDDHQIRRTIRAELGMSRSR